MDDRQRRVLESIENLILHPNTSQHEMLVLDVGNISLGEKWTGRPKTRPSSYSSGAGNQNQGKSKTESRWGDFYKDFGFDDDDDDAFGGFGGFYNGRKSKKTTTATKQEQLEL